MPISEYVRIRLEENVSKYLDFLKMELKQNYTTIINDLIKEKYKELIKERYK